MKNYRPLLIFCFLFACLIPHVSQSCTTFSLDQNGKHFVGKNVDYIFDDCLIIINKRNVSKTAMLNFRWNEDNPVSWVSKYGSVTFNIGGRDFAGGGMNEVGLVIETMLLSETEYPLPDSRAVIASFQWRQYMLDNFSTVEEVISSDSQLRIRTDVGEEHYFVCDSTGNCAVIEFLGGEMVYYPKDMMPVKVLTNSTYTESLAFLYEHQGWGGDAPIPDGESSLDRFAHAADMVNNYDPATSAIDYAFNILSNVTQSTFHDTYRSIVYDLRNRRIHFHTLGNNHIRYLDLSAFDFSCKTPVKVLEVNEDLSGDVSGSFIDYTYEINRDLIEKAYSIYDIPGEELDYLAHYPESTVCTEMDCFIATASYGSPVGQHIGILRKFRDRFLLDNAIGKTFLSLYNTYSPPMADFVAKHDNLREMVGLSLLPIIGVSWLCLNLGPVATMLLMFLPLTLIRTTAVFIFLKNIAERF